MYPPVDAARAVLPPPTTTPPPPHTHTHTHRHILNGADPARFHAETEERKQSREAVFLALVLARILSQRVLDANCQGLVLLQHDKEQGRLRGVDHSHEHESANPP